MSEITLAFYKTGQSQTDKENTGQALQQPPSNAAATVRFAGLARETWGDDDGGSGGDDGETPLPHTAAQPPRPVPVAVSCRYRSICGKVSSGRSSAGPYRSRKEQTTAKLGHKPGQELAAAAGAAMFFFSFFSNGRGESGGERAWRTEGFPQYYARVLRH